MAFNQRLFSAKLSNSFQSFKHWKEMQRIGKRKKRSFARFVFRFCTFRFCDYNRLLKIITLNFKTKELPSIIVQLEIIDSITT